MTLVKAVWSEITPPSTANFFSESRQLYPSNKYHIYLDQFDILYFLRGDFQSHLKTMQFAIGDSVNLL